MNLGEFSITKKTITLVCTGVAILAGWVSYNNLSRLEDPEFTIKTAIVACPYPGASAREVEQEVTDELEQAAQRLGQLKNVRSRSTRGMSLVKVDIKDQFGKSELPQVWDEMRRKMAEAETKLPPGAGPVMINDDFGDVYGIFLAITGEEYSRQELQDFAEFLKVELLLCDGVKRVEFFGQQKEVVLVEMAREQMTQLGVRPDDIFRALQEKNLIKNAGSALSGPDWVRISPQGGFTSLEQFGNLLIRGSTEVENLVYLKDVASIRRAEQEPPGTLLRRGGQAAIGIGVSTVQGGNVVKTGEAVIQRLNELKSEIPLGVEFHAINLQSRDVTTAIDNFINNLIAAVIIVVVVLLIFMGLRSGMIIGFVLFLTICASFVLMDIWDVTLERISLGALIIALGMLVDNAIVITEGMLIRIQKGMNATRAAGEVVGQTAIPLLGATVIAIMAFGPIGLSNDNTGEYCRSLFMVLMISLSLSWVTAVTTTPVLCSLFLKGPDSHKAPKPWQLTLKKKLNGLMARLPFQRPTPDSPPPQSDTDSAALHPIMKKYQDALKFCLKRRTPTLLAVIGIWALALFGFRFVGDAFFPPSTRAQFMVDFWLPAGTDIRNTNAAVSRAESYLLDLDGVTDVTSIIGAGALRFILNYSGEQKDDSYAQFLVDVDSYKIIDDLIPTLRQEMSEQFPDALIHPKKFMLGPGEGGKIQIRFYGPDYHQVRILADQAMAILRGDPQAITVRIEAREKVKVLRPILSEQQAELTGITQSSLSKALLTAYEGRPIGVFREGDRLLPIIARAPDSERGDLANLDAVPIWSPVAQKTIPVAQVISGIETGFEDFVIERRDRRPIITVHADAADDNASALLHRIMDQIEAIPMPDEEYFFEWGGEYEKSSDAQGGIAASLPAFFLIMVLITIFLFNALRQPLIIWCTVPLAIIGISFGLLFTGLPFDFMALLGALSLSGMLIKNAIVLIDEIDTQIRAGKERFLAVIDSATSRVRPVSMAALTTVLGMLPLLMDPFFASMSVAIMVGLTFATVLTLIVVPVLYAVFFRIDPVEAA